MSWSFETSLLVFLVIIFLSQAIATLTQARLSLPLMLGIICIIGFGSGFFPADFLVKSKMKDVGFIAFNVLMVHSGTTLDMERLKSAWKPVVFSAIVVLLLTLCIAVGLKPVLGRQLAMLAPGPVIGGGAACALASNFLIGRDIMLSPFPWMIFMAQGLFSVPVFAWAVKQECRRQIQNGTHAIAPFEAEADSAGIILPRKKLCDRIPQRYRTTSFYLSSLMAVSVFNRWLHAIFLHGSGINPAVTALLFGMLFGQLGWIERDPLSKSDSMGFLMLGLMALMANSFAQVPLYAILKLVVPTLFVVAFGTLVLVLVGLIVGGVIHNSTFKSLALALSCMVGFPFSGIIAKRIVASALKNERPTAILVSELLLPLEVSSLLVTNFLSIFIVGLVAAWL